MKVVCIDNLSSGLWLTKGKVYDVLKIEMSAIDIVMAINPHLIKDELGDYIYTIRNDRGDLSIYWSHQFDVLGELREIKLNQLV